MENSATSKVIGQGTIQLYSHDGCITTLQGIIMFSIQNIISSILEPYIEKGSVSVPKVILWKSLKRPI